MSARRRCGPWALAVALAVLASPAAAQVTTCGQAQGNTSQGTTFGCPPALTFNVSGQCLSACGAVTSTFMGSTVTATGHCFIGGKCSPNFVHLNAYNATSREFFSQAASRYGLGCSIIDSPKSSSTCSCVGCAPGTGGPAANTGTGDDPLLISLTDFDYRLSSLAAGVAFDLDVDGEAERTAWTLAGADDAFLVLDRDGNGTIDNGLEVFGDGTPQLPSAEPNGFRALAVFDDFLSGGNGDGRIDGQDPIFAFLQLWTDSNHDGLSAPAELQPLAGLVSAIHLDYGRSNSIDEHGNDFRYWANIEPAPGSTGAAIAFNVFLAQ